MKEMEKIPAAESIRELLMNGLAMAKVNEEKEMLYAILPEGCSLATHDLAKRNEEMEDRRIVRETGRPMRNTGLVTVADVDSFVLMVRRELIPATTIIRKPTTSTPPATIGMNSIALLSLFPNPRSRRPSVRRGRR